MSVRIKPLGRIIQEKGKETRRLKHLGELTASKMETICDYKGVDLTVESLEFATNYNLSRVGFDTYNAKGEIDICDTVLERNGLGMFVATPFYIHTHESILWLELIYDDVNKWYKFGLGYPLRFHNGTRITIRNPDSLNPHNVSIIVQLSIRG